MTSLGPVIQPNLQPVIAHILDHPPMVRVRPSPPLHAAGET